MLGAFRVNVVNFVSTMALIPVVYYAFIHKTTVYGIDNLLVTPSVLEVMLQIFHYFRLASGSLLSGI